MYVSGNLALDLVGTLNERWTTRVENLHNGADVAAWLVGAGVLDTAPPTDGNTLSEALRLRESAFALVQHLIDTPDKSLPVTALEEINRAAAQPAPQVALRADGRLERHGDWQAGLAAVARDAIALANPGEAKPKWCADPACTHPFLDRSRGHRRRWCEMKACGDRAKARAYRARLRATD